MSETGLTDTPITAWQIVRACILALLGLACFSWALWRSMKKSEQPLILVLKWVVTLVMLGIIFLKLLPMGAQGGPNMWSAVALGMLCGLVLAATWRHSIASTIATPFMDIYDGGSEQEKPKPFYSVAL